jgi:hypothetical protein
MLFLLRLLVSKIFGAFSIAQASQLKNPTLNNSHSVRQNLPRFQSFS